MDKRAGVLISVLILSISTIPFFSDAAEAIGCAPFLALTQAKQTAYVAPGQDGVVTFMGTVYMQVPWTEETERIEARLYGNAGNWVVSSPVILEFSRAEKQKSFTFSVHVPIGTSQKTQGQFLVNGTWEQVNGTSSGTLAPATAIIFVKQFYDIDLSIPDSYIVLHPGDEVQTRILLKNEGNAQVRSRLEISNLKDLEDQEMKTYLDRDKFTIEEKEVDYTNITVSTSRSTEKGLYRIRISVVEAGSYDPEIWNQELFIEVGERKLLGINYGIWIAFEWTLILILGMVTAFIVMTKKKLTRLAYSKLSRTLE